VEQKEDDILLVFILHLQILNLAND